jgi:uncharacterized protein GlcG (DUF336 family)
MTHDDLVVTQRQVRLGPAMECLQAGLAKAAQLDLRVSIAIVDTEGHTVAVVRMDGSGGRTDEGARGKASTAANLGVSTAEFIETRLKQNEALWRAMSSRPGTFMVEGGFPLLLDGKAVGGVGASGAKAEQDALVSGAVAEAWDKLVAGT